MALLKTLLLAALLLPGQLRPHSEQSAERKNWWPRVEAVDSMLAKGKWPAARKRAARLAESVKSEAWYGGDLDRVLAALALQQAIAEINLGEERAAEWHWYIAANLSTETAARDLSSFGRAATLSDRRLREPGRMPSGDEGPSDVERLRLEPVTFPRVAPPDILTNAAAVLSRQPDITVEVLVDRTGRLHDPVVLSERPHPVLLYTALEWLAKMPPAEPARLDGRAIDSLEEVIVNFKLDRSGGQIFLEPPDG